MPRRAVFLDRDGTLNVDKDYLHRVEDWEWIPGAVDAIRLLNDAGYLVIVTTNQSGIARGLFTTHTLFSIHDTLQRALGQTGGRIDAFFFCPHAADSGCECRKPQPGMLLEVARRFNVSLKDTYMVGDSRRDLDAATAAGARPVLVLSGQGRKTRDEGGLPPGTQVFADLAAFAEQLAP